MGTVVRGKFDGEGWGRWAAWWIGGWWRGQRFSVGAGAYTYTLASRLPTRLLDTLLAIPHRLTTFHAYLSGQPLVPMTPRPPAHARLSSSTASNAGNRALSASRSTVLPTAGEKEKERGEGAEDSGTIRTRPRKSVTNVAGSLGITSTGSPLNAVNTPNTPTPTLDGSSITPDGSLLQSTPTLSSPLGQRRKEERDPGSPLSSPEEDDDDLYPSQPQSETVSEFDFSSEGEGAGPDTGSGTGTRSGSGARSARSGTTTGSWVNVRDV